MARTTSTARVSVGGRPPRRHREDFDIEEFKESRFLNKPEDEEENQNEEEENEGDNESQNQDVSEEQKENQEEEKDQNLGEQQDTDGNKPQADLANSDETSKNDKHSQNETLVCNFSPHCCPICSSEESFKTHLL